MDDYKKTIEALRICGAHNGCDGCPYRGKHAFNDCSDVLYGDAADAIEALQAENKAYMDTWLTPEEIKELCTDEVAEIAHMFRKMIHSGEIDHLSDLLKSEQEGRLIVLPCKVGDTVYGIICGSVVEGVVYNLEYENLRGIESITVSLIYDYGACRGNIVGGDVTVFLNREEAEAALEGVKMDG